MPKRPLRKKSPFGTFTGTKIQIAGPDGKWIDLPNAVTILNKFVLVCKGSKGSGRVRTPLFRLENEAGEVVCDQLVSVAIQGDDGPSAHLLLEAAEHIPGLWEANAWPVSRGPGELATIMYKCLPGQIRYQKNNVVSAPQARDSQRPHAGQNTD